MNSVYYLESNYRITLRRVSYQNTFSGEIQPYDRPQLGADWVGVGFLSAMAMTAMRTGFLWCPFHPAGYAISLLYGGEYYWSCLVISSIIKFCVLRYGGYCLNRQVIPLMFGIILGEYSVGAGWSFLSLFLNHGRLIDIQTYDFCPG